VIKKTLITLRYIKATLAVLLPYEDAPLKWKPPESSPASLAKLGAKAVAMAKSINGNYLKTNALSSLASSLLAWTVLLPICPVIQTTPIRG